uniref:A22 protein n=1 Tax=Virus NIOZ-UU159 TaxID=2763270 RepID=A0A7S9SUW0_9VIRU|nr:MAG: A22 protein [Virus NIOZ-UU159]|tara:strand:+ start:183 stop:809 length:627 start_codon:yes stop_codon:yes gene_type:complete
MIYISFDIGIKNLALCILRKTNKIEVLDWRIIALADSKKELKGIDDISERVYYEMDNIVGFLKEQDINTIDYVLIENQPSNLNGVMKTIQHIIYNYFSLIKHWDKEVENVVLVNASLKSKTHNYVSEIKPEENAGNKNAKNFRRSKYLYNKKLSIDICQNYIKDNQRLLDIFANNNKKDDLSDSCLQAVSYIRTNIKNELLDNYNVLY